MFLISLGARASRPLLLSLDASRGRDARVPSEISRVLDSGGQLGYHFFVSEHFNAVFFHTATSFIQSCQLNRLKGDMQAHEHYIDG